jgi:hypothetical protein
MHQIFATKFLQYDYYVQICLARLMNILSNSLQIVQVKREEEREEEDFCNHHIWRHRCE